MTCIGVFVFTCSYACVCMYVCGLGIFHFAHNIRAQSQHQPFVCNLYFVLLNLCMFALNVLKNLQICLNKKQN